MICMHHSNIVEPRHVSTTILKCTWTSHSFRNSLNFDVFFIPRNSEHFLSPPKKFLAIRIYIYTYTYIPSTKRLEVGESVNSTWYLKGILQRFQRFWPKRWVAQTSQETRAKQEDNDTFWLVLYKKINQLKLAVFPTTYLQGFIKVLRHVYSILSSNHQFSSTMLVSGRVPVFKGILVSILVYRIRYIHQGTFQDDFPFPKLGYVSSLKGIHICCIHTTPSLICPRQPGKEETRESSLENVENGTPSRQNSHVRKDLALDVLTVKRLLKQWAHIPA